jgi:hypothetical protein
MNIYVFTIPSYTLNYFFTINRKKRATKRRFSWEGLEPPDMHETVKAPLFLWFWFVFGKL